VIANSDGSNEQKLVEVSLPSVFGGNPAWSPDGKVIALMEYFGRQAKDVGRYVAVDAATGSRKEISTFAGVGEIRGASWLPDGSGLLMAFGSPATNYAVQIGYIAYPSGQFRRITNDLNRYDGTLSATRDAKSIVTVATETSSNIWVMPGSGTSSQAIQISSGKSEARELDWTPDGRILSSTLANGFEFDLRASDGSGKVALFSDAPPAITPSACGDGQHIVFSSFHSGKGISLWKIDSHGGNLQQLTDGIQDVGQCSPDGKWVYYGSLASGQPAVWKISIDGGTPVRFSPGAGFGPAISPDGNLVAYASVEGSEPNLRRRVVIASSTDGKILHTLDSNPRWRQVHFAPDSRSLACQIDEHGVSNIWIQPISGGAATKLTDFKSDLIFDFAWSRDGKKLALSRGEVGRDVVLLTDNGK
jgi:Tol biopolymer transport system component